jgi:hypothetical protein
VTNFLPPVIAVLGAEIGEYKAKLAEARGEMKGTQESLKGSGMAGKTIFLGVATAVAGVAYEATKMTTGFNQEMEMVHTQAGAAQTEVDGLKGKVESLAPAVGMGPETLAEGLYHIESAGFRGAAAMDILTSSAKLAKIGQSDFEATSQAVVGVMASQIKGVKDASDAAAILNATVGIGDMRMTQLANAIGTGLLPKAASVGATMTDVSAALATVTDNVTPADEAATRLGMTFSLMAAPTEKAKGAYESIGMASNQMANDIRSKGLLGALKDLKEHLDATYPPGKAVKLSLDEQRASLALYSKSLTDAGVPVAQQTSLLAAYKDQLGKSGDAAVKQSEAISAMFGGGKSSGTILTLLNELPRMQEKVDALGTSSSRAAQMQEAWAQQQKQFGQELHQVGAAADVLMIKVGTRLLPIFSTFLGWVQKGASWLDHHRAVVAVLAGVIGGALVAALYGAVAATIAWTAALDVNPIFLVITALGALVGGLIYAYNHSEEFRKIVDKVGAVLKQVWTDAVHIAGDVINWFVNGPLAFIRDRVHEFGEFWQAHGQQIETIARHAWSMVWSVVSLFGRLVFGTIQERLTDIRAIWKFTWDLVRNTVKLVWNEIADEVTFAWHLLLNIFSLFADLLTGKWGQLWKDAKKLVSDAFHDIIKIFSDWGKNAWNMLYQAGRDLIQGVINGVKAMVKRTTEAIEDIGNTILGWGKKGGTLLVQAGKDIVMGLIHGVENSIDDVNNMFTSVGKSAVHAVEKVLDMHSPSRVFYGLGQNVARGLVNGMAAMQGEVGDTAARLANSAVGGFNGPGTGLSAYAVGSSSYAGSGAYGVSVDVPDFEVKVFLDGKQVRGSVQTQTLRYQNRNSRNGLSLSGVGG